MSIWVELRCDKCDKLFDQTYFSRENVQKLKEEARANGWAVTYKTGMCTCPNCLKKDSADDGK